MAADPHRPKTMLVLGGTRSGKSEYAESLVAGAARVTYVATAAPWTDGDPDTSDPGLTADGGADPEWSARLATHRARRPATWRTEETGKAPEQLASLIEAAGETDTLLVDDLGGWLAALLDSSRDIAGSAGDSAVAAASYVTEAVGGLAAAIAAARARVILVSPEVGMTVVPATRLGRTFTDAMGSTNRAIADACDVVALVVAGQPMLLRGDTVPAGADEPPGTAPDADQAARRAEARQAAAAARAAALARVAAPSGVDDDTRDAGDELRIGMSLPLPDDDAAGSAANHASRLPVAGPGLRDLVPLVSFVAGATGDPRPAPFTSVRVIVIDGSHEGAIAAGDSAELWADRRADGANALHRLAALTPEVTVEYAPADPGAPLESGPAMTDEQRDRALRRGFRLANAAADRGDDAIVLAAGGPGLDAAATALVAGITRIEVAGLLGRVHGPDGTVDDEAWMRRCVAIRDTLRRVRDLVPDGPTMLSAVGGPGLALATGVLLGAAFRRTPVFIDGPVGAAAALAARDWATQVRLWCALVDLGGDATVKAATDRLGVTPLFAVGLGLGEGANALALLPVVQAALTVGTLGAA